MSKDKKLDRRLYDAVKTQDAPLVKNLLAENGNPNAPVGKSKMTAMCRAALPANSREIEMALRKNGGLLDPSSLLSRWNSPSKRNSSFRLSTLARAVVDGDGLTDESTSEDDSLSPPVSPPLDQWEVDRACICQKEMLGEGMFGSVYAADVTGLRGTSGTTRVAAKQLKPDASADLQRDFHKEAKVMKALSSCERLIRLLGVCTQGEPLMMLLEFMPRGDLKTTLRASRPKLKKVSPLSLRQLGIILRDIAEGMAFLAGEKIVHRDLAARNCLVTDDYRAKIGDFGLTRHLYSKEYYRQANNDVLPVRWMAPEALTDGIFTTAGDVWSFGVVLWEVGSFAKLPYGILTNHEVFDQVCEEDHRLPRPPECPEILYDLTASCWHEEPEDRTDFKSLLLRLQTIVPKLPTEGIVHHKVKKKESIAPTIPNNDNDPVSPKGLYDNSDIAVTSSLKSIKIEDDDDDARSVDSFEDAGYITLLDNGRAGSAYYSAVASLPDQSDDYITLPPSKFKRTMTKWVKPSS